MARRATDLGAKNYARHSRPWDDWFFRVLLARVPFADSGDRGRVKITKDPSVVSRYVVNERGGRGFRRMHEVECEAANEKLGEREFGAVSREVCAVKDFFRRGTAFPRRTPLC